LIGKGSRGFWRCPCCAELLNPLPKCFFLRRPSFWPSASCFCCHFLRNEPFGHSRDVEPGRFRINTCAVALAAWRYSPRSSAPRRASVAWPPKQQKSRSRCLDVRRLDVRYTTSSTFKGIKAGQAAKSSRDWCHSNVASENVTSRCGLGTMAVRVLCTGRPEATRTGWERNTTQQRN
jgi:hypothetical protein